MGTPFLGEIKMMSFSFAPTGWALCDGTLLQILQNPSLYSLIGTTFGGDGTVNFAIPDLRDRVLVHVGPGYVAGQSGGSDTVTLSANQLPIHSHMLMASSQSGNSANPSSGTAGNVLAQEPGNGYSTAISGLTAMNAGSVGQTGGGQPHPNDQPYLTISFCIALQGTFPSPNV